MTKTYYVTVELSTEEIQPLELPESAPELEGPKRPGVERRE